MGGSANPNMVQPQGGQYGFGGGQSAGESAYRGGFNQFGADGYGASNNQATLSNQAVPLQNPSEMFTSAQPMNTTTGFGDTPQPATPQNPYQQASQAQTDAMGMTRTGADMIGSGAGMVGTGANIVGGALGALDPAMQRVGQGMTQTAAEGMSTYQNPYEDQVVQQSMRDIGNQGLQMQNQLSAQAGAAGAFGGSRHGIAEAELAKSTQQQMLDQAAKLRQQGFTTALGASQADLQRQLGAAGQSAGIAGQAAGMGGQIAGMGGQLSGMGTSMGGLGSTLSGLGQTSFGMANTIADRQAAAGGVERGIMDQLIGAGKGQYGQYTQQPTTALNTLLGTITGTGAPTYQGSSSSFNPGLFNIFQTLAMMPKG